MARFYLTKEQKAEAFARDVYSPIIEALMSKYGRLDTTKKVFSDHVKINPDTWNQWRKVVDKNVKDKPGVDVKKLLKAAYFANLKIKVEVTV